MAHIVIAGAGFAGLGALQNLSPCTKNHSVTLIDKSTQSNFLPLIPDIIGRRIPSQYLQTDIARQCTRFGARFINEEITALDLKNKKIKLSSQEINYDYAIIACGTQTNFYGNTQIQSQAFTLDSAQQAVNLHKAIQSDTYNAYVISGAGYTGIELASNIRVLLNSQGKHYKKVIIVERSSSILGPLPDWMKQYVMNQLHRMDINCLLNTQIEQINNNEITFQGVTMGACMLIWTAGVIVPAFIQALDVEKNPQGRVCVDKFLRVNENCFFAGDCACFMHKKIPLRMAVQFALYQGAHAANNIIALLEHKQLRAYRPVDCGYIIPLANNAACGRTLGVNVSGILALWLHYLMCIYRSYGRENKNGILRSLLSGGRND